MGMERLGKGLVWNGPRGQHAGRLSADDDSDRLAAGDEHDRRYELRVHRAGDLPVRVLLSFEGTNVQCTAEPAILSGTPWDTRMNHTSVNGLCDVAAIGVTIAVVDPASRISCRTHSFHLAGQMNDFAATMQPGQLETQWTQHSRPAVCRILRPRPFASTGACSIYPPAFSDVS